MDRNFPRLIHYCWYGKSKFPDLEQKCINSWKKYIGDHKMVLWNEENSPMDIKYLHNAYKNKKWANISNFMRLYALYNYGGWYFDTDVELIKTPNFSYFDDTCFLALETKSNDKSQIINNAVVYSIANHPFIQQCLNQLQLEFDGSEEANLSSPILTTNELKKNGFNGLPGSYNNVRVLTNDYFYPAKWYEKYDISMKTDNTVCIHHNNASWIDVDMINNDSYRNLIKDHTTLKEKYRNLISGNISLKELVMINFRYLRNMLNLEIKTLS